MSKSLKKINKEFMGKRFSVTVFLCMKRRLKIHEYHLMERRHWSLILNNFLHDCHQTPYAFKGVMRNP